MTRCIACGWDNRAGALYCAHCGALFTRPADAPEPLADAADATPTAPLPTGRPTGLLLAPEPEAAPLVVGAVFQGRFQIVEQLTDGPSAARSYRAIDLERCAACGAVGAGQTDGYCAACGAARATPCFVRLIEQSSGEPPAHDEHLALADHDYYLCVERAPHAAPVASATVLRVGARTDPGAQRDKNEDSIDARVYERTGEHRLALLVVADGLGGQASGEVASQLAVQSLWQALYPALWAPTMMSAPPARPADELLREAALSADRAVAAARAEQGNDMSSTLVAALVVDGVIYIANVGDSRAYLLNPQGLRRLTHDHSLVQRLVDAGKITPEEVFTHPHRNVIYNSLGDADPADVDIVTAPLCPGDRLLLCSDGLWEMVRDEGIEEVLLSEPDPQRACDVLVDRANLAGGEDNISVIIAQLALLGTA